jgi:hypothetical protein
MDIDFFTSKLFYNFIIKVKIPVGLNNWSRHLYFDGEKPDMSQIHYFLFFERK